MKKYWLSLIMIVVLSFAILIWIGSQIYQQAPPIPRSFKTDDGTVIVTGDDIKNGQNVWQSIGGMELGSIWGHGSYTAPDWSADWLHRECVYILDKWSQKQYGLPYSVLSLEQKGSLTGKLEQIFKINTYDKGTETVTLDPDRAEAFEFNLLYYRDLFINGNNDYSIRKDAQTDSLKLRQLAAFFFWTSWSASVNRPGENITYTSNWPHEKLINNTPTGETIVWTGFSIMFLLIGVGGITFYYVYFRRKDEPAETVNNDPMTDRGITPSQKALIKYLYIITGLFLLQIITGVITAHYGVEGSSIYGVPLAKIFPYSLSRTWHVQLAMFWIATAWVAGSLYLGPAISGQEPVNQRIGVNILFVVLIIIIGGALIGQWLSILNKLTGSTAFLFGHQGYEYLELGRIWQALLLVALILWLVLLTRSILPIIRKKTENRRTLLSLILLSSAAIVVFYIPGFFYGQSTNLAIVEYWRWWVVHLWIEGFFEVFATVVIAYLFSGMGLIRRSTASIFAMLTTIIFLSGGIIGTLHHLYFSGTPTIAIAFGSVFSAWMVVPLGLVGYEAWVNYRFNKQPAWIRNYKWPIYFFLAVSFWNLVGAGLFGFMLNPPIALYYMQGLNTTSMHGHAALFGVYGLFSIGLILFILRSFKPDLIWNEELIRISFWGMNGGLILMILLSLLPIGLLQTYASVDVGYWYARSNVFMKQNIMIIFKWLRIIGDTVFAFGAIALIIFIFKLTTSKAFKKIN